MGKAIALPFGEGKGISGLNFKGADPLFSLVTRQGVRKLGKPLGLEETDDLDSL